MSDSLNAVVGLVWSKNWHGFNLSVICNKRGKFRSLVLAPWDEDASMCKTHRDSLDDAIKRCWGMVYGDCELKAAQAQSEMRKPNNGSSGDTTASGGASR